MNIRKLKFSIFAAFALMMCAVGAQAQANRTYVRHDGADAGTCPVTAPCLTLNYALSQTNDTGFIVALDTFGYGQVSITKAVTIEAVPGAYIFIKPQPSTIGVTINPGNGKHVILRGLQIDGQGGGSTTGISQTSGTSSVSNSQISNVTTGISITGITGTNAKMDLINSDVINNTTGVVVNGKGTNFQGNPVVVSEALIVVNGGNIVGNGTGFSSVSQGTSGGNALSNITFFAGNGQVETPNVSRNGVQFACFVTPLCTAQPIRVNWQVAVGF